MMYSSIGPCDMAGPPGFEPGTLPQERVAQFFSGDFPWVCIPRGKSNIDAAEASPMLYLFRILLMDLAELRALFLRS